MVLKWTNRGANAIPASKPAPMPVATPGPTPVAEVKYDGAPMKSAAEVFKGYGKHIFTGKLADYYLKKNGSSIEEMSDSTWVKDRPKADKIAAAVLEW